MPPLDPNPAAATLDTIVALSTPAGKSAIGVVRLSGPAALQIAGRLLQRGELRSRRASLNVLLGADGEPIDEVVCTAFPGPRSYTGEDVVEISCHGSPPVLRFAVERSCELGARIAEPGEFTRRAWRNGRMDLVQAEAVRDLIDATTLYQAQVASRQRSGALSGKLRACKRGVLELIARLEAGIDFAEDDIEVEDNTAISAAIDPLLAAVERLVDGFALGKVVRSGLRLAIVGRPNVGKSSLFNRMLERDRAIVSQIAGTTRDVISDTASFDGIPVELVDTAGIRASGDEIETAGIERTWQSLQDADCALVVVDLSTEECPDDLDLWRNVRSACPALLVGNKRDLPRRCESRETMVEVSALTGEGIDGLRTRVRERALPGLEAMRDSSLVTNIRQEALLRRSKGALQRAAEAASAGIPHEMLLLDLYEALEPLDAVTGATTIEQVLDEIFSTFCIGK